MVHLRASARRFAVALAVVFCIAGIGCATSRPSAPLHASPVEAPSLTPAEEHRAQALAEYGTGVSEEIQGDLDAALDRYQRVLQLDPHNTPLAIRVGQIYVTRHNVTNAVNVLESSARANPNDPAVAYWLGFVYRNDSQNDKALAAFRQALSF